MRKFLTVISLSLIVIFLFACGAKKTEEYKDDLINLSDKMLGNSAEVEELLNQYSKVWNHTIKSRGAIPIDEMSSLTGISEDDIKEYFVINSAGNLPDDFSTSILSLKKYYEGSGILKELQDTSDKIKESVSELNDPPKDFKETYDELLDMYNLSEKYIEMALNPSGSLQNFNEDKKQLASDILSKHKHIEVIIPNK